MNLDRLWDFVIPVVMGFAITGNLDQIQRWVWMAQARLVYESRTETWGSPRFFESQAQPKRRGPTVNKLTK
jgi:hypothetical protein